MTEPIHLIFSTSADINCTRFIFDLENLSTQDLEPYLKSPDSLIEITSINVNLSMESGYYHIQGPFTYLFQLDCILEALRQRLVNAFKLPLPIYVELSACQSIPCLQMVKYIVFLDFLEAPLEAFTEDRVLYVGARWDDNGSIGFKLKTTDRSTAISYIHELRVIEMLANNRYDLDKINREWLNLSSGDYLTFRHQAEKHVKQQLIDNGVNTQCLPFLIIKAEDLRRQKKATEIIKNKYNTLDVMLVQVNEKHMAVLPIVNK